MPEEIEVPTEHLHETLNEHAHGGGEHEEGGGPNWFGRVALSAAILAVLAAVAALLAGHHANEAMLEQMKATDDWAFFQAKGIKASLNSTKIELLQAMKVTPSAAALGKADEYTKDQKEIEDRAHEEEHASQAHMHHHEIFAKSVTAFQVGIAMSAIAVLARKKALWYMSMVLGTIGAALFVWALIP